MVSALDLRSVVPAQPIWRVRHRLDGAVWPLVYHADTGGEEAA
jgi:hypothetical protein